MTFRKECPHRAYTPIMLLVALLVLTAEARDRNARRDFMKTHPCPATGKNTGACPGWVVDHMWPLACGGDDHPLNMQWQTIADAKEKDKWGKVCGSVRQ